MATKVDPSPWLRDGEEKRQSVRAMFAEIAPTYDLVNSMMSLRLHYRWRSIAVKSLSLQPGDSALDVCCGTGDFLLPLRQAVKAEGQLMGVDFCFPMLQVALKKPAVDAGLAVADACCLPLASQVFDGVTVGWGLRNVPSIEKALSEAHRVLKSGGRFVSLDMARPKGVFGAVSELVFHHAVPFLGSLFGKRAAYTYLPKSTLRFLAPEDLMSELESVGFVKVWKKALFFGNIAIVGGQKP